VKPRLKGEAYLIRYIDDFVVCFQYQTDAQRFQEALVKRLDKFALQLEPSKTRLIEFGRFAKSNAKKKGKKPETVYFLGITHYCTTNRKGNFIIGRRTEKTRFKRSVKALHKLMLENRHWTVEEQAKKINQVLQGHYAYYGLGGNMASLQKYRHLATKGWYKALKSRSWRGISWDKFNKTERKHPLRQPKLKIPYSDMGGYAVL
jgi:hypothetical protein